MQKEFEDWYVETYYAGDRDCGMEWLSTDVCGGYIYHHPSEQWKTWQASRDTLWVELPESSYYCPDERCSVLDACREAIHAAGVRTK